MMTREGFHLNSLAPDNGRLAHRLTVVASAVAIREFKAKLDARVSGGIDFCEVEAAEQVPTEVIDNAYILVIEVDPGVSRSLNRVAQIHARRPKLPQIVALADANIKTTRQLLRQGIADVVSLPFDLDELFDSAATVAEDLKDLQESAGSSLCPMLAVVRARGGEGATTIATHLAGRMIDHTRTSPGLCIIDLDVQSGSVAPALGVRPRRTLEDLLTAGGRLDRDVLKSVAVDRGDGIHVIAAPEEIHPLEQLDVEQLFGVIELARKEFDFVILDLPADWTSWNLSALTDATAILLVVEAKIASLRQAKRRLDLFKSVGIDLNKVSIVVNRVERKLFASISLSDINSALHRDVIATLPDEGTKMLTAQDQGLLISEIERKSKFDTEIANLAVRLWDKYAKEELQ